MNWMRRRSIDCWTLADTGALAVLRNIRRQIDDGEYELGRRVGHLRLFPTTRETDRIGHQGEVEKRDPLF